MRLTEKRGFVVGVTAGSGAVAAISSHSGADFLLAINAARLRNMGAPSIACMLPVRDAVRLVDAYADTELLPQVDVPVLIGINCWRDGFDAVEQARGILERGFAGVVNFPPSSLYPDTVQRRLEIAGVGFSAELAMLRAAQDEGCMALAYCRTVSQGRQAALARVDNILLNFGWNSGGRISPRPENTLDEVSMISASFSRQVRRIRPEACLLLEGGPVESKDDLETVLRHADIDGYIGGSTFERLPVERSITDRIASFKLADNGRVTSRPSDRQLIAFGQRAGFVGSDRALLDALLQLREARQAKPTLVCVHVPPGDSCEPPIGALTRRIGTGRAPRLVDLSVPAQIPPDTAAEKLFGGPKTQGICTDTLTDVIILRNPEALDRRLQSRLAAHISTQALEDTARRPRFILISHQAPGPGRTCFQADLAALFEGALIRVPGLHERPHDIEGLLNTAIRSQLPSGVGPGPMFSPAALLRLRNHEWAGNTGELVAMCARLAKRRSRKPVSLDEVDSMLARETQTETAPRSLEANRREVVVDALKRNGFRKGRTAQALGISRKTLYNWMKREGLS